MKRYQYLCFLVFLSSPVLSADVTYSGTYSQLNVKLCSDTSPSRSLLPSGSLVCEVNPPQPDTICTGSWDYASTDIFNCGPAPTSTDLNGNGVDDDYEDWDGDGLKNGEDPDPYYNQVSDLDENKDGIPDFIEDVYDDLAQVQDILYCNSDDAQCQNLRSALNTLASTNSVLASTVRDASLRNVGRNDFNSSIGALTQSVNDKTSNILDAINNIDIDVTGGVDNTDLLVENFNGLSNRLHSVDASVESVQYSVNSLFNSFNGIHQHMDQNKSNIVDAINNNDSSVDLSGVESSISDLSSKIDGLEVVDMSGVEGKIDNLIGAVTNDKSFSVSSSGFTGEGFLFNQHELSDLQEDVIEIKQEVTEEMDKFKTLFSIDTSSFNDGTFKEHSLNLRVNGSEQSFKSGVFTALLDNAAIISAVIMFLFVLSGIRMLGRD
ncbi:hypothetical protein AB6D74_06065 [Vibrio cyclitrophicus]|uniref:hypothetical protein n=1 Tax=Vibrio cyclitrophicus TaxID=47951 RepID=UPI001F5327AE|nr:hypothetical protein [Vibrio cyclitrophicus]